MDPLHHHQVSSTPREPHDLGQALQQKLREYSPQDAYNKSDQPIDDPVKNQFQDVFGPVIDMITSYVSRKDLSLTVLTQQLHRFPNRSIERSRTKGFLPISVLMNSNGLRVVPHDAFIEAIIVEIASSLLLPSGTAILSKAQDPLINPFTKSKQSDNAPKISSHHPDYESY